MNVVRTAALWIGLAAVAPGLAACGSSRAVTDVPANRPAPSHDSPQSTSAARLAAIRQAAARIARHVNVDVTLPDPLPSGARLGRQPVHLSGSGADASGQLDLVMPGGTLLSLLYGNTGFDGCGDPAHVRSVRIGGRPGLLGYERLGGHMRSQVVWPATAPRPQGDYGLAGILALDRALALARSMRPKRGRTSASASPGC
jgi:hypothetical protein